MKKVGPIAIFGPISYLTHAFESPTASCATSAEVPCWRILRV
jgi:hypothetical protein